MKIELTGRHVIVSEIAKDHADAKMGKLESHYTGLQSVKIVLSQEKISYKAEARLSISRGSAVHGLGEGKDVCAAIDDAFMKLDRQLSKAKKSNRHGKEPKHIEL